jgi:hypothetical protein
MNLHLILQILIVSTFFGFANTPTPAFGVEPPPPLTPEAKEASTAPETPEIAEAVPANPSAPSLARLGEYPSFTATGDISRFAGEKLYIDISFLWFENAAKAEIGLYKNKDGSFYSILQAETLGFVGFFTSYRKHVYRAEHQIIEGGRRLRTTRFVREVTIADEVEKSINVMNYETRVNKWYKFLNEQLVSKGSREIPPNAQFDGILAAFYNFRNGVYGPFKEGADYSIHTIPEKNTAEFKVHVLSSEERSTLNQIEGKGDSYSLRVTIPPEIFKTSNGELQFWSSKHLIPIETIVEDYFMLGDLHAKLNRREMNPPIIEFPQLSTPVAPKSEPVTP